MSDRAVQGQILTKTTKKVLAKLASYYNVSGNGTKPAIVKRLLNKPVPYEDIVLFIQSDQGKALLFGWSSGVRHGNGRGSRVKSSLS